MTDEWKPLLTENEGGNLFVMMVKAGLAPTRIEANRMILSGQVSVNGQMVAHNTCAVSFRDLPDDSDVQISVGSRVATLRRDGTFSTQETTP